MIFFCLGTLIATLVTVSFGKPVVIRVDGSSTVYPISEAAAEEFQNSKRAAVRVTVGASGTGGGFKRFCRGETDVQGASRPISLSEVAACEKKGVQFVELPVAYDALSVVVSTKNTWLKSITVADLKKIWEPEAKGKVIFWNQIRADWPRTSFRNALYGPGSEDGTFDSFTKAIMGKERAQRSDYTPSEDDNTIVTGVGQNANAMGYVPYAYLKANENLLRAVPVDNGRGPISPSIETVRNGAYTPLSRPLFVYIKMKSLERPEVAEFSEFLLRRAGEFAEEVKYVPLSAEAYSLVKKDLSQRRGGTRFGGQVAPGRKLEDILRGATNGK